MPCTDGGPDYSREAWYLSHLCSTLKAYEAGKPFAELKASTREWWEEHKERDREKAAKEAENKARKKLAKKVMERLTPEERKALREERYDL